MATNLYAKLIDGIPTTTCAAEEDTDLIAQILADGFKPYDDSAPQPSVEELQAVVLDQAADTSKVADSVDTKVAASKVAVADLRSAVSKSETGGFQAVEKVKSAAVDPAASGSKLDSVAKLAAPSLAEPIPTYRDDGDRIVLEWKVLDNSPAKVAAEIARLQSLLTATDYQVIKCYEFVLAGEMPPYDPAAIHASRQALRNRIAELEALTQ